MLTFNIVHMQQSKVDQLDKQYLPHDIVYRERRGVATRLAKIIGDEAILSLDICPSCNIPDQALALEHLRHRIRHTPELAFIKKYTIFIRRLRQQLGFHIDPNGFERQEEYEDFMARLEEAVRHCRQEVIYSKVITGTLPG